jgi:hypothetical protein
MARLSGLQLYDQLAAGCRCVTADASFRVGDNPGAISGARLNRDGKCGHVSK